MGGLALRRRALHQSLQQDSVSCVIIFFQSSYSVSEVQTGSEEGGRRAVFLRGGTRPGKPGWAAASWRVIRHDQQVL